MDLTWVTLTGSVNLNLEKLVVTSWSNLDFSGRQPRTVAKSSTLSASLVSLLSTHIRTQASLIPVTRIHIGLICFRVRTCSSLSGTQCHATVWLWSGYRDWWQLLRQKDAALLQGWTLSAWHILTGGVQLGRRGGSGVWYERNSSRNIIEIYFIEKTCTPAHSCEYLISQSRNVCINRRHFFCPVLALAVVFSCCSTSASRFNLLSVLRCFSEQRCCGSLSYRRSGCSHLITAHWMVFVFVAFCGTFSKWWFSEMPRSKIRLFSLRCLMWRSFICMILRTALLLHWLIR